MMTSEEYQKKQNEDKMKAVISVVSVVLLIISGLVLLVGFFTSLPTMTESFDSLRFWLHVSCAAILAVVGGGVLAWLWND